MKFKLKPKTKSIIAAVLCIATIVGCAAGAIVIFGTKTKEVNPAYSIGSLDNDGNYHVNPSRLYTKDLIECKGISVTPEFDTDTEYQIYWYNKDGKFIGQEVQTSENFEGQTPDIARYCRIVLAPNLSDENAALAEAGKDEEFKFTIFNIPSYADDINIKVNRDQTFAPVDYFADAYRNVASNEENSTSISKVTDITSDYTVIENASVQGYNGPEISTNLVDFTLKAKPDGYSVIKLWCGNVDSYEFNFGKIPEKKGATSFSTYVFFYTETGEKVEGAQKLMPESDSSYIVNVPDAARYMCVNVYPIDLDNGGDTVPFVINEYMWRSYSAQ